MFRHINRREFKSELGDEIVLSRAHTCKRAHFTNKTDVETKPTVSDRERAHPRPSRQRGRTAGAR